MATLIERPSSYYAQFYSKNKRPCRKRLSLRTNRRRTAERILTRLEAAWAGGTGDWCPWRDGRKHEVFGWEEPEEPADETAPDCSLLGEAKEVYLTSCAHLKASTRQTYRDVLDPFTRHVGPETPVIQLRPRHILQWLDSTKAGVVTRHKYVNHLGYLFRFLVRRGFMAADLSKEVPLRKIPQQAPKAMTEEQVEQLLEAITDHVERLADNPRSPDYTWLVELVRANVHLGLRRSELVHLRWEHVDLGAGRLRVVNTEEFTTKSGRERTLPLSQTVHDVIGRLWAQRCSEETRGDGYVFTTHRGGKIDPEYLGRTFLKFRRQAGLPEAFSFHSTRHTCLTWLAERGVPVMVIKEIAGHANVRTTERYVQVRATTTRHWVDRVFSTK